MTTSATTMATTATTMTATAMTTTTMVPSHFKLDFEVFDADVETRRDEISSIKFLI